MKTSYTYFFVICGLLVLNSCSRKNNNFVNRNFHALTTKYNTLHNGDKALTQGKSQLIEAFEDNYWDVLPVEQLVFDEDAFLAKNKKNGSFETAVEKAVKAIRSHSMNIKNEEVNYQIDEAFMVLGKARYYNQDYIPALEAFNYILQFYPTSNSIWQANVWKAKTNIRLGNNEIAIKSLKNTRYFSKMNRQDKADVYSILGQAYYNVKNIDTSLYLIKKAAKFAEVPEEKGRYNYIKAQLYEKLGFKDSARQAYSEVIDLNRRIPRKYWIHAQLAKIENLDFETDDTLGLWKHLVKLRDNREHRPFKARMYYTIANYYTKINQFDSAVAWHNRSLRAQSSDKELISRNYTALAEYNFDNANYQIAGAYYDSTMSNLNANGRAYRSVNKKRINLDEVIEYELLASRDDSLLNILSLSGSEQITYFEAHIKKLKEKAKADSIIAAKAAALDLIKNKEFFNKKSNKKGNSGQFYFYNTTAAAYGKQSFEKQWGKRPLEENWRLSNKNIVLRQPVGANTQDTVLVDSLKVNPLYVLENYLSTLPQGEKAIDSIKIDRDFAYFQLGLIYKEKFKEFPLAIQKLESLLQLAPKENLVLPAKYNLYQLYDSINDIQKKIAQKENILTQHKGTRFATILENPNQALVKDAKGPEARYENTFTQYQNGDYLGALEMADQNLKRFYGDPIVPKFELLKARLVGRLDGIPAYKEALTKVALAYPRKDEGKRAQALIDNELSKLIKPDTFALDHEARRWKLIYEFKTTNTEAVSALINDLNKALAIFAPNKYRISTDVYNRSTQFVVVHGLPTKPDALIAIDKLLVPEQKEIVTGKGKKKRIKYIDKYKAIAQKPVLISSKNYAIITVHKNYKEYVAL